MSNTRDGGYLVVGVEQTESGSFKLEGISDELLGKISLDDLKRKIIDSGSPRPDIDLHQIEFEGRTFLLMTVRPSSRRPVICVAARGAESNGGSRAGVIYYRTGAAESAPATATDWEEIITRFYAEERVRALSEAKSAGLLVSTEDRDAVQLRADAEMFDAEIEEFR